MSDYLEINTSTFQALFDMFLQIVSFPAQPDHNLFIQIQ